MPSYQLPDVGFSIVVVDVVRAVAPVVVADAAAVAVVAPRVSAPRSLLPISTRRWRFVYFAHALAHRIF